MSLDLHELEKERAASAVKINNGRQPQFGDHMRNPWAGESNPNRDGYFVRSRRVTGKLNPGLWYEMTDKRGRFWEIDGVYAIFIEHLEAE